MNTPTLKSSQRTHRRVGLSTFAALIAFSAYAGAAGLILGFLKLDDTAAARLPLSSPVLGGIALALIVAVPTTVLAVLALRDDPRTDAVALLSGLLLVGWIVVELAFIREFSFFHPTYLVVGTILLWVGRHGAGQLRALLTAPSER